MTGQSHSSLTREDHVNLESARDWVRGHFTESPLEKYEPLSGKLRVLEAILENNWIQPNETVKLQSLGVTLGDALAQELMLEWVIVDDEYGRTAALNWPGISIYSYPITMISNRIEDGETVDIHDLFRGACTLLRDNAFSGLWV